MKTASISLLLCTALAAAPAVAADCFGPGARALQERDHRAAAEAFRAAIDDPHCAADAEPLRYNLAVAQLGVSSSGEDPAGLAACEAEAIFRELIAKSQDADLVTAARADIGRARARCTPPPPPSHSGAGGGSGDRALQWALTASAATALAAGGLLIGLALDADAERAEAKADFINATSVIEQARAEAQFEPARDRTTRYGLAAYTTLGLGAGLGIAAVLSWLSVSGESTVGVTPGGAVLMHRF